MALPFEEDIEKAVQIAYSHHKDLSETEIAFFGGSFTAIDKDYMLRLLKKGSELVENFSLKGIRISTRPDFIDKDILSILKNHKVTAIELGAQSMDDEVLFANDRGHTSEDIINASELIRANGFELGLQMMTGLYLSNSEKDYETALKIAKIHPDTLRVYPTVVFKETRLCELFQSGEYIPQTLDEAVKTCSKIIELCEKEDIKIIRIGLHSSGELQAAIGGVNHPAFTELCLSHLFLKNIKKRLKTKGKYIIYVNPKEVSVAIGQKKSNLLALKNLGFIVKIKENTSLKIKQYIVEEKI